MSEQSALVRRATVEEIVGRRNKAIACYDRAFSIIEQAEAALKEAREAASQSTAGVTRYNYAQRGEREKFIGRIEVPTRTDFMTTARRLTDTDAWSHIIEITDLERLMDKKAKDQFQKQLMTEPPELTVDNVMATLEQFAADAGMIFKRGIAECFSNLDRRFKSHDGWKIGSRVILSHAFDVYGSWCYGRNHRDTIQDIERTFLVLDGRKQTDVYAGLIGEIEQARGRKWGARQTEVDTEFFLIRIFKNGNAHIWFKRDDLLERVNKLLGEYYGNPLPEDRAPDADTGLHDAKTTLAKNFGFYPTPDEAADRVIELAPLRSCNDQPLTVLEPSAGTGNLASRCVDKGAIVDCIEIHAERAEQLRRSGRYRRVLECDFLAVKPNPDKLYDRVVMNPPFDRERDIDHVMHALKFLKPEGILTAVMSAGTEFRENKKSIAFREHIEKLKGKFFDLPARSFSSVGTNCNTVVLRVAKDGKPTYG